MSRRTTFLLASIVFMTLLAVWAAALSDISPRQSDQMESSADCAISVCLVTFF
ncbi:MAG: hypothetical protein AAGB02_00630 [Pseudomonadota bacterium]